MVLIKEYGHEKLNLTLDVLHRRNDGYHEVEMIMQTIALSDVIEIDRSADGDIHLTIDAADVEDGDLLPNDDRNLAVCAAKIFIEDHAIDSGVVIHLKKSIPIAAGLAGGSADAAAVIRGINRLFDLKLSIDQLCAIGEKIGSDVPFCIVGGTCLAYGRGEKLKRLPDLPTIPIVLVKPRGTVPTAWAYKHYDETPSNDHPDTKQFEEAIRIGDIEAIGELMFNVLEPVSCKLHPSIVDCKEQLLNAGATAALMSGTGPTVFGIARSIDDAERIAATFNGLDVKMFITTTIGRLMD